jgi:hypothetical protein
MSQAEETARQEEVATKKKKEKVEAAAANKKAAAEAAAAKKKAVTEAAAAKKQATAEAAAKKVAEEAALREVLGSPALTSPHLPIPPHTSAYIPPPNLHSPLSSCPMPRPISVSYVCDSSVCVSG